MNSLDVLPATASTYANELNSFFWVMVALCGVVAIAIAVFIVHCAVKYRRRDPDELPDQIQGSNTLEWSWTSVTAIIFLGMFGWGAKTYFDAEQPPPDTLNVWVVGKQWMWKVEHSNGIREIDTLHVPVDRSVRLTMISEDVIHDFFVPAFRVKQDVLPQRYVTLWFKATKPGKYHLLCAEYCGAKHSGMIGWVYAMESHDYQRWVQESGAEGSLASTGEKWFHQFGCANCHRFSGHGPGPDLRGLYGTSVTLDTGVTRIADEAYIRDCIVGNKGGAVFGFKGIMPNFTGQVSEEQLIALVAYIKSIGRQFGTELDSEPGTTLESQGVHSGIVTPGITSNAGSKPGVR
ncbi:MAG TPA: cytochrome c oxidase subunit II [Bryobacteraceae bacterium]|nr:cytochrome c oxidase subunit II [Bryobacteraceae bacterium]